MRIPSFFFFLATSASVALPSAQGAQAAAYVIADQTTGVILEGENAQKKLQIGSLTKIAAAIVVLDWAEAKGVDLGQPATVPNVAGPLNSNEGVGLRAGDRLSLRDLLYAALMQSDNLAAQTLADHVGHDLEPAGSPRSAGSAVTVFVAQMNALARRLGMSRTLFLNPHGLDSLERRLPYSTAEDIARLTAYAMSKSAFRFYVSQRERKITIATAAGEQSAYLLRNTNELLGTQDIDGVKTGTTQRAGQCLVISAVRPPESRQDGEKVYITPRRLNIVLLGARDRFGLATQLLAHGWQLHEQWAAAGRPAQFGKTGR
jgi:serine-type D-Ala-D-Ala carboxypeptidase (penicillin-binding protein 5/6)